MVLQLKNNYILPDKIVEVLKKQGIGSLYPPQEEALSSGVLDGKNLVLAIPTAAGKTLIAEICMVKSILEGKGHCLYIVPLRALASEKYEDFQKKYGPLGISVGVATGEYDSPGTRLAQFDILVATSEKVDSLLRMRSHWLGESLSVVVLDEIHYIHDPERGPTLEIVAARLHQINPNVQILALSATISNSDELARWLGAELVSSDWRPVPLLEGVYSGNKIHYSDSSSRSLVAGKSEAVTALVNDTLEEGGQILVFVNSRRSAVAVARSLSHHLRQTLPAKERSPLKELAAAAGSVLPEPTHLCRELSEIIKGGVAFHHAGLHQGQRKLIEDAFRANRIKVIVATPTLAAGVNLPARRVVIRDWARYEMGRGQRPIPVFEYKQFAGRAGRPGYDSKGEALIVAKKEGDLEMLFERYIHASSEPLRSQLGSGASLSSHILASIASGYATSREEIMGFLSRTFFAAQNEVESLAYTVDLVLGSLIGEELITCDGCVAPDRTPAPSAGLRATTFGAIVSRLYLTPHSGLNLKEGLLAAGERAPSEESLLHLICCCPDMDLLSVGKDDFAALGDEMALGSKEFLVPPPDGGSEMEQYRFLQAMHTARLIRSWIAEEPEEGLCESFRIGPGDLRRIMQGADWLLYSAQQIAALCERKDLRPLLKDLQRRVLYGIKEELLDLVSLKGIGRVRARSLFRKGYKTIEDLRGATVKQLSKVPSIGPQIAENIKKQV
ncbi:MAG: DEAD/DEAH box helicase [Candidatus Aureabacteria bacterium]|nr:DEAD/DEAH box helicase [Candidatus Auribacterota bacterium]